MKQYVFSELGYFSEREVKAIKEEMDGETYMKFQVKYSNFAGNCTLIVETDYKAEEIEIKNFFIAVALGKIFELKRNA